MRPPRSTIPGTVAPRRPRVRRSHRRWRDRGAASTEVVIVMPLLLLLVLGAVHVGLWFHASHIVHAAAQEGARAARALHSTDAAGHARATQLLDELGSSAVTDTSISVDRSDRTVTVTVTGRSPAVVPGLALAVATTSTSPVEEFTP